MLQCAWNTVLKQVGNTIPQRHGEKNRQTQSDLGDDQGRDPQGGFREPCGHDPRSNCQSAQKSKQHHAECIDRVAHQERQNVGPDHFIDERQCARQDGRDEQDGSHLRVRSHREFFGRRGGRFVRSFNFSFLPAADCGDGEENQAVHPAGQPDGSLHSEMREKQIGGNQGPRGCPDDVHGVKKCDFIRESGLSPDHIACQRRQGSPHQNRRDQYDDPRQTESDRRQGGQAQVEAVIEVNVNRRKACKQTWDQKTVESNQHFQDSVNPKRGGPAVHDAPENVSAQRQSSQEGRKNGADGVGGVSEGIGEQAREDGFEDQARGS